MAVNCDPNIARAEFWKANANQGAEDEGLRVVLLGKTGSGKSSVGNTLLGRDTFEVARGMCSGTDKCQHSDTRRMGVTLQVTDTPGVCDTHRSEVEVLKEVGKSLVVASPGPHVILMILRCDRRFTKEEYDAYVTLKRLFGEEICNRMIVVFAGIDCFGCSREEELEERLHQAVETSPPLLKNVIRDAMGRYCGVDNTALRKDRERQADRLMERIQNLVALNGGSFFSSDLYDAVNEHVQTIVRQRMQDDDVPYGEAMKCTRRDVIEEKASLNFFRKLVDIVGNKVLPVLRTVLGEAIAIGATAVSAYCSLM